MTRAEELCAWVDRIVAVAMRHMPEGQDRHYVEVMAEQYRYMIRDTEGRNVNRHGAEARVVEAAQQRSA